MSAVREARADAPRRLLDRRGGEFLLDAKGWQTLAGLGFSRAEANRALDDLAAAGDVEFAGDWPMLFARLRRDGA